MNNDRKLETYRQHKLLAQVRDGVMFGLVWTPSGKKVHHSKYNTMNTSAVMLELKKIVEALLGATADESGASPQLERVIEGLRAISPSLTAGHLAMLKAHYRAPNRTLTATELAKAAGYANFNAVNLQYGQVGARLYEHAPCQLPIGSDGRPVYTFCIATGVNQQGPEDQWQWQLRPEVAQALEQLGLHS